MLDEIFKLMDRLAPLHRRKSTTIATVLGFAPSGLPGPKGNLETFVWLAEGSRSDVDWPAALAEVAV